MPLTRTDKQFLGAVDRLKILLLLLAVGVFLMVLMTPPTQLTYPATMATIALCGLLWVTQRLLTLVTVLDIELTKAGGALKRTLTDEQRRAMR